MKRLAFFTLAIFFACCSCNSQRHAARRIGRIAERHPELVAPQAHPIDTLLALPSVADSAIFSIVPLLMGDTITIPAAKGSFKIGREGKRQDSLAVSYHAEQQPIRFTDTIRFAQVVIHDEQRSEGRYSRRHSREGGNGNLLAIAAIILIASFLVLIFRICNRNR